MKNKKNHQIEKKRIAIQKVINNMVFKTLNKY